MEGITLSSIKPAAHRAVFAPWPSFEAEEIEAVRKVLASGKVNYWTGEEGRLFEQEFAAGVACEYAVAVMNGSVALELALHAVGLQPGDEVIVPSRTFVATASSVVLAGAQPVFADVDLGSQNITAETIREVITPRTRAIIAVHLAGWPCEMDEIMDLAEAYGLHVIEDCAQAHGAEYKGRPVGGLGHVAAFSFCQDKIMTTGGEGGMVTTNDPEIWEKAWSYKDHGKNYEAVHGHSHSPGYRWVHDYVGTNWRLTEMQSAIGRVLLKKVPEWLAKRRAHVQYLMERLQYVPGLRVLRPPAHIQAACYKYYVFIRPERLKPGWNRHRIMVEVERQGVPCFSGSCSEVYEEKAFKATGFQPSRRMMNARILGQTSLMFLVHPTLSRENIADTCEVLGSVMRKAAW